MVKPVVPLIFVFLIFSTLFIDVIESKKGKKNGAKKGKKKAPKTTPEPTPEPETTPEPTSPPPKKSKSKPAAQSKPAQSKSQPKQSKKPSKSSSSPKMSMPSQQPAPQPEPQGRPQEMSPEQMPTQQMPQHQGPHGQTPHGSMAPQDMQQGSHGQGQMSRGQPQPGGQGRNGEPPMDPATQGQMDAGAEAALAPAKMLLSMYPSGKEIYPGGPKFPPFPDPTEMMRLAKEAMPEAVPGTCEPTCQTRPGTQPCVDPLCIPYPAFCKIVPLPPAEVFAAFTEPFPCFLLTRKMFEMAEAAKLLAITSFEKCLWDYALCFLYACYPGMNPLIIVKNILSGRLNIPPEIEDRLPKEVRDAWEMRKNMPKVDMPFGK